MASSDRLASGSASALEERGFTMLEALITVSIIIIMTAAALYAFGSSRRAYRPDDAANKVVNFMRDAYQRALAQRQAMLLEIDTVNSRIRIVDGGRFPNGDEAVVREDVLVNPSEVRMDQPLGAGGALAPPAAPYNYAPAVYNNGVWQAWFRADGSVVDNSANPAPLSATFYFWPTNGSSSSPKGASEVRAVTLFGPSGSVRYWSHNGQAFVKEVN
ncbi:MAG TPA: type II secretion system protein [Blastocatellia bacterium]|nr:type II secretion system protein [Blastocatellia bacterium]